MPVEDTGSRAARQPDLQQSLSGCSEEERIEGLALAHIISCRIQAFSSFLADQGLGNRNSSGNRPGNGNGTGYTGHGPSALIDANRLAASGYCRNQLLFRAGLKTCFCDSPHDWERFDHLFDLFWFSNISEGSDVDDNANDPNDSNLLQPTLGHDNLVGFAGTSSQEFEAALAGAGDFKALSLADFRFVFNPLQMLIIERMVDDLARRSRQSFLRRRVRAHNGTQINMRRTLSRTIPYNGHALELHYLKKQRKLPKFVLLLDVSQSMEVYAKLFLRFARKLIQVFQQSEVFAFNTQLIALGSGHSVLSEKDFEDRLNAESRQWLGGTKISASLQRFNDEYAPHVVNHRTTVVVFSDGCDTAEPEELAEQTRIIQQKAKTLLWVNPLLGRFKAGEKDPYMDPVVPYIDKYRSAHNIHTLEQLKRDLLS